MEDDIETLILSLSDRQKAVFAGLVCERLLPQYAAFCAAVQWGSPAVFQQGVELLYNSADGVFDQEQATALLDKFKDIAPDLDEFDGHLPSYALDACVALDEALQFLTDKHEAHIINCATAATDTIDMFVQEYQDLEPSRRDLDAVIAADPFMLAEQARQRRILEALLSVNEFDNAAIQRLRQLNGTGAIIDLALLG